MKTLYESILDTEKDWDFDVLLGPLKNMFESRSVFDECLYILQDRLQKSKLRKGKRSGWMITLDFGWNANTMKITDGKEQVWEIASIGKNKDLFIEYHKSNDIAVEQIINSKVVYGVPEDLEPLKILVSKLTPTVVHESLLDIDKNYDNDILISLLFSKDIQHRRDAFERLLNLITSYKAKQQKTTAKMKNSDSYFIQFTKSFKIKNGEVIDELMPYISYIYICKRTSLSGPYAYGYRTTFIDASDDQFAHNINDWVDGWRYTQSVFKPQIKGCALYEIPEELNSLFNRIQMEASNHK